VLEDPEAFAYCYDVERLIDPLLILGALGVASRASLPLLLLGKDGAAHGSFNEPGLSAGTLFAGH
jgi:hypothetical protein